MICTIRATHGIRNTENNFKSINADAHWGLPGTHWNGTERDVETWKRSKTNPVCCLSAQPVSLPPHVRFNHRENYKLADGERTQEALVCSFGQFTVCRRIDSQSI